MTNRPRPRAAHGGIGQIETHTVDPSDPTLELVPGTTIADLLERMHAKCVVVDGERAFVSSANFTSRGQERNIEAGVLLHDATFAAQLERQWLGLIGAGLVARWRCPD